MIVKDRVECMLLILIYFDPFGKIQEGDECFLLIIGLLGGVPIYTLDLPINGFWFALVRYFDGLNKDFRVIFPYSEY